MSCNEIQKSLSLYCDDGLAPEARKVCYEHLEVCPVCRAHLSELRSLRQHLSALSTPVPPENLVPSINAALRTAAAARRVRRDTTFADIVGVWLEPRLMRYAFSSIASIILFGAVFIALRPHAIALHEAALAFETQFSDGPDINKPISPESYASLRNPYNAESPSLNPKGALAVALSEDHLPNSMRQDDDDMVVVADVFSNGSASLADVMQAPRDRRMLDDFQKALRANAAFVPAAMDRRAGTMRVVFSVQRVDVKDRNF